MKRKLRIGMVGGGSDSQIGPVHRLAALLTGRYEIVAGSFSSNRQKAVEELPDCPLQPERVYGSYRDMLKKEARLPEDKRIDLVAITAPNNMHYPISMASIDAGFHILCERPMATTLDEALNLRRKLKQTNLLFGLTVTGCGFPMLIEARRLVTEGQVGEIRRVVIEYPQGWMATRIETSGNKQAGWRTDPRRSGPSGCLADLGSHGLEIMHFVTGLDVTRVCAATKTCIPGRQLEDDGTVMMQLSNGAQGLLWASQICIGEAQGLSLRIYGDKGSLSWRLERPAELWHHALDGTSQLLRAGGTQRGIQATSATWLPSGLPEGYLGALANVYRAFAETLDGLIEASGPKPSRFYPTIDDGVRSVAFIDAVVRNIMPENEEKWTGLESVNQAL